ncbi:MAG: TonB-dependent receptor [Acidobacteriaceae bacterium]
MTKRIRGAVVSCLGLGLALLPHVSHAQAVYGSINGTVTDNTGASIPNATITVTDEAKGTSVTAQSNGSGGYTVEHLIPDLYNVKVAASGFQSYEQQHLQINADTSPKVDAQLTVGAASQTVQVNANEVPELKTDRADVSTILSARTVEGLPVANRNFTSLELLQPGAQLLGFSHAASENPQASQQIQIDGQAFGGVAYELDGTDNQDPILGIIVINPNLDAITEAKIATQNFDAEFGKAVAAVVTVQTKSGGNSFHGSAFDYRQSNANLARNPFTQNPPAGTNNLHGLIPTGLRNQFGGSIGGPIKKDKAFFFGDYQGLRQKIGTSATATVPSPLVINTCLGSQVGPSGIPGCDFSQYATALNGVNPTGAGTIYQQNGQPYPGNVIPTAQVSPQAKALFALLQPFAPNQAGNLNNNFLRNNYSGSGTGIFNSNQWDVRVDYQLNDKIHAFGRFSRFTDTLSGATLFGAAGGAGFGINNFGGTSLGANDSTAAGADIAINATLLTDFRLGYYRYGINTSKYNQNVPFANQLGIPGLNTGNTFTSGAPAFNITEVGSFGNPVNSQNAQNNGPQYGTGLNITRCNCPLEEHEDQYQIVNNWTKIFGNHSLKFGADLRYARNLRVPSDVNRTGELSFGTGPTSNPSAAVQGGLGFATLALGDVTSFGRFVSVSTNAKEFQKRTFFYAQDTWRATPALTINYGLRWELYFPEAVNARGNGALLHLNTGFLSVAGVGNVPSNMGWSLSPGALAPRIGVAYQLNPKTVIRAGYGRSFDIGVFGSIFGHVATQNLPVLANQQITATGGLTSSAFNLAVGPTANVFPTVPANGLLPAPGYAVSPKARPDSLRLPTIDAWNLSIQRSITPSLSLTMAYVGNKGTHTLSAGDGNNTNPNEAAIVLPAAFSVTGQALHYDPSGGTCFPAGPNCTASGLNGNGGKTGRLIANNATSNATLLQRYYGGNLPACSDPNYATPSGLAPGQCGWTNGISYYGDDQDTHYNALQITVAKEFSQGLSFTSNFAWQRAFDWSNNYATWDKTAVKGRNNDLRELEEVFYATYELPFGRNHRFASNVPGYLDEVIGGWQVSPIVTWASGLPFTLTYNECSNSIPSSAPCYPNGAAGSLKTNLGSYNAQSHNRLFFRGTTTPLTTAPFSGFSAAGLDQIGNSGRNNVFGPSYISSDMALQKNFPIHESLFAQFRVDAYNVFNHPNPGNPGGGGGSTSSIDNGDQFINNLAPAQFPTRQLQFSVRVQF